MRTEPTGLYYVDVTLALLHRGPGTGAVEGFEWYYVRNRERLGVRCRPDRLIQLGGALKGLRTSVIDFDQARPIETRIDRELALVEWPIDPTGGGLDPNLDKEAPPHA